MEQRTAWITGSAGLIGSHLIRQIPDAAKPWKVVGLNRSVLDLTDFAAVKGRFHADAPTLLIHCAALSQSGQCERQPELARRVNVELTALLSDLFQDGRIILFSTDLVFNGKKGHYVEDDEPDPLSVYGRSKVEAEQVVRKHPNHVIIRTSLNGGVSPAGNRAFNEALIQAWSRGETTTLFTDEFRCPIPATVTARATWELACSDVHGTFHVAGAERLNRYEIAGLVAARHPEVTPRMQAASLKDYTGPPRVPDGSMVIAKAQRQLSFPLPGLTEWLRDNPNEPF